MEIYILAGWFKTAFFDIRIKQTTAPSRVPDRLTRMEMITVVFRPSQISS